MRQFVRLFAILVIFVACSLAWLALAGILQVRTQSADSRLSGRVAGLWGEPQAQPEPVVEHSWKESRLEPVPEDPAKVREVTCTHRENLPLRSSRVGAGLSLEHRRKGLLWYSTYRVRFQGRYVFAGADLPDGEDRVVFRLPSGSASLDNFRLLVDGREIEDFARIESGGRPAFEAPIPSTRGRETVFEVSYESRGLDEWRYALAESGGGVRDFELAVTTDFAGIDFADGTTSPTHKEKAGEGWLLRWAYQSRMGGGDIAVVLPHRLNPGPLAARMTLFAPVSLAFFLGVLYFLYLLRGIPLHPMHFAFLAASFFAFHLLFAHLVDHLDLFLSFGIASAVSVALVVSYLRIVVSPRFAFFQAGALQILYLVLFSFAHFFEGWTGLVVTAGAIVTLFVVMQATARVKWEQVLERSPVRPAPAPAGA